MIPGAAAVPGTLYAWGANHTGQGGGGPGEDLLRPRAVPGLPPVVQVACNAVAALALDAAGQVWSWGWNDGGLLGRGEHPPQSTPIWTPAALRRRGHRMLNASTEPPTPDLAAPEPALAELEADPDWQAATQALQAACPCAVVAGLPPIVQVVLGDDAALALDHQGQVWAWGADWACGRALRASDAPRRVWTPHAVAGLVGIRHLSLQADGATAYAVDADGRAWSWGGGWDGELGQGKRRADAVPAPIDLPAPVRCLSSGRDGTLALLADGAVWGWGNEDSGLGFRSPRRNTVRVLAPVPVQRLPGPVQALWVGSAMAVYRLDTGDTWVSGHGLGMVREDWLGGVPSPVRLPPFDTGVAFCLGSSHGFAVDAQGVATGFGRVECGALGNGDGAEDVQAAPFALDLPGPVAGMAVAGSRSLAICGPR